ncbi:unnamed protein product [Parnassius apollo]|uniref:(apollo) hypothetical protein n=1 Tax=Parnassius apollo TaxID=110799 RepID=A0A8S3XWW4_PARAO|nr:unnamed protein product [Parnassius apollo]
MDKEKKDNWKCPTCKSKQRKFDNTNTPVQGCRMDSLLSASDQIIDGSEKCNLTQRKPLIPEKQPLSPSSSSIMDDKVLVNIIRREIQQSVTEAVESAVKMYFSKEFDEIKSELATLREIGKSVEFLSSQYDRMNCDIKNLQNRLTVVTKENLTLSSQALDISDRFKLMEQHSRETNIEINGVPENMSENLLSLANNFALLFPSF